MRIPFKRTIWNGQSFSDQGDCYCWVWSGLAAGVAGVRTEFTMHDDTPWGDLEISTVVQEANGEAVGKSWTDVTIASGTPATEHDNTHAQDTGPLLWDPAEARKRILRVGYRVRIYSGTASDVPRMRTLEGTLSLVPET